MPYTIDDAWEDADLWLHNWMDAHPEEAREPLDILLSADYGSDSPYWPLRDAEGTLIAFTTQEVEPQAGSGNGVVSLSLQEEAMP